MSHMPGRVATSAPTLNHNENHPLSMTTAGAVRVHADETAAGEDVAVDVQKVEERYLTIPIGGTDAMVAADQLYKSGPGYVRSITMYSDATATAKLSAVNQQLDALASMVGGKR